MCIIRLVLLTLDRYILKLLIQYVLVDQSHTEMITGEVVSGTVVIGAVVTGTVVTGTVVTGTVVTGTVVTGVVVTGAVVTATVVAGALVTAAVVTGDLVVAGSDPPEQASISGTVIPTMTTARITLAIALIVTRKL